MLMIFSWELLSNSKGPDDEAGNFKKKYINMCNGVVLSDAEGLAARITLLT